jgi:uncharacterized protein (TIGR03067 family)
MNTHTFSLVAGLIWCSAGAVHGKDDAQIIQGAWKPIAVELAGQPWSEETLRTLRLIVKNETYTVKVGEVSDSGTLKLDSSKSPRTMDIVGTQGPNKGMTFPAIYELKDETLRICYDLSGKERPTEFKTAKDTQLFLVTYVRDKTK